MTQETETKTETVPAAEIQAPEPAPASAPAPADETPSLREVLLSMHFAEAVGAFGARTKSSLREIRDAFDDRRADLVSMQEALKTAVADRESTREDLTLAYIFFVLPPIGIPLALYFHSHARREDREIGHIVEKIDAEVAQWKTAKPKESPAPAPKP